MTQDLTDLTCPHCGDDEDANFERTGLSKVIQNGYFNEQGQWEVADSEYQAPHWYDPVLTCSSCGKTFTIEGALSFHTGMLERMLKEAESARIAYQGAGGWPLTLGVYVKDLVAEVKRLQALVNAQPLLLYPHPFDVNAEIRRECDTRVITEIRQMIEGVNQQPHELLGVKLVRAKVNAWVHPALAPLVEALNGFAAVRTTTHNLHDDGCVEVEFEIVHDGPRANLEPYTKFIHDVYLTEHTCFLSLAIDRLLRPKLVLKTTVETIPSLAKALSGLAESYAIDAHQAAQAAADLPSYPPRPTPEQVAASTREPHRKPS